MADDQHSPKPDRGEPQAAPEAGAAEAVSDLTLTWEGTCEPSTAQINIPRQVGNVRLGEELGRGGMGVVLTATSRRRRVTPTSSSFSPGPRRRRPCAI